MTIAEQQIVERIGDLTIKRNSLNDQIDLLGTFILGATVAAATKPNGSLAKPKRRKKRDGFTAEGGIIEFLTKRPASPSGDIISAVSKKYGHTAATVRSTIGKMVKTKKVKSQGKNGSKEYTLTAKEQKG